MKKILFTLLLLIISLSLYAEKDFDNSNVSIPWSDFKDILKDLKKDTARIDVKPVLPADFVISDILYNGRKWNENEFLIEATLTVSVLEPQKWVEISLGRGLTMFPNVKIDGKPATIGLKENGSSFIILKKSGKYVIKYRFLIPQNIASGQSSLSFPMPGQTVARIRLELDRSSYSVIANDRSLIVKSVGKKHYYEGGLGSGKKAYLSWKQEAASISGQQAMVMGQLNTIYSIGMGMLQLRSQINLNVIHKDIREFSFIVPKELDIIDFTGHAVATWEAKDSADNKVVTVYLKYSLRDKSTFLLNAECSYNDTSKNIILPDLSLQNATRQEGTIGVGVLGNVELKPIDNSNNVLRRDKRELPGWFNDQGDVLYVYQYLSGNYSIKINLTPHGNIPVLDALVTSAKINSVIRDDGKMVTQYDLNIRNRGVQFLRLNWKDNWQLWSVYCNDEPARPAFDTLNEELLIPLKKATDQTAETKVSLVYLSVQKKFSFWGKQKITYPTINMPLQNISGALYSPEAIRSLLKKGNLKTNVTEMIKPWFGTIFSRTAFSADYFAKPSTIVSERISSSPAVSKRKKSYPQKSELGSILEDMETEEMNFSQSILSQSSFEAGQLSIPVVINFEGKAHQYSTTLLNKSELPFFSFWYYKGAAKIPDFLNILCYLLVFLSAILFTLSIYKGFSKNLVVYGILLPFLFVFITYRVFDKIFYLDYFYFIPLIFLFIIFLKKIFHISILLIRKMKIKKPITDDDLDETKSISKQDNESEDNSNEDDDD